MIVDLQAGDRWEAIDELIAGLIVERKLSPESWEPVRQAVKKRESSMSTGIGLGIAIPHASTDFVSELVYTLGYSKQGVNFDALDNQPVKLVLFFLVPQGQFQKHVHILANLAKILHKTEFIEALENGDTEALDSIIRKCLGL